METAEMETTETETAEMETTETETAEMETTEMEERVAELDFRRSHFNFFMLQ